MEYFWMRRRRKYNTKKFYRGEDLSNPHFNRMESRNYPQVLAHNQIFKKVSPKGKGTPYSTFPKNYTDPKVFRSDSPGGLSPCNLTEKETKLLKPSNPLGTECVDVETTKEILKDDEQRPVDANIEIIPMDISSGSLNTSLELDVSLDNKTEKITETKEISAEKDKDTYFDKLYKSKPYSSKKDSESDIFKLNKSSTFLKKDKPTISPENAKNEERKSIDERIKSFSILTDTVVSQTLLNPICISKPLITGNLTQLSNLSSSPKIDNDNSHVFKSKIKLIPPAEEFPTKYILKKEVKTPEKAALLLYLNKDVKELPSIAEDDLRRTKSLEAIVRVKYIAPSDPLNHLPVVKNTDTAKTINVKCADSNSLTEIKKSSNVNNTKLAGMSPAKCIKRRNSKPTRRTSVSETTEKSTMKSKHVEAEAKPKEEKLTKKRKHIDKIEPVKRDGRDSHVNDKRRNSTESKKAKEPKKKHSPKMIAETDSPVTCKKKKCEENKKEKMKSNQVKDKNIKAWKPRRRNVILDSDSDIAEEIDTFIKENKRLLGVDISESKEENKKRKSECKSDEKIDGSIKKKYKSCSGEENLEILLENIDCSSIQTISTHSSDYEISKNAPVEKNNNLVENQNNQFSDDKLSPITIISTHDLLSTLAGDVDVNIADVMPNNLHANEMTEEEECALLLEDDSIETPETVGVELMNHHEENNVLNKYSSDDGEQKSEVSNKDEINSTKTNRLEEPEPPATSKENSAPVRIEENEISNIDETVTQSTDFVGNIKNPDDNEASITHINISLSNNDAATEKIEILKEAPIQNAQEKLVSDQTLPKSSEANKTEQCKNNEDIILGNDAITEQLRKGIIKVHDYKTFHKFFYPLLLNIHSKTLSAQGTDSMSKVFQDEPSLGQTDSNGLRRSLRILHNVMYTVEITDFKFDKCLGYITENEPCDYRYTMVGMLILLGQMKSPKSSFGKIFHYHLIRKCRSFSNSNRTSFDQAFNILQSFNPKRAAKLKKRLKLDFKVEVKNENELVEISDDEDGALIYSDFDNISSDDSDNDSLDASNKVANDSPSIAKNCDATKENNDTKNNIVASGDNNDAIINMVNDSPTIANNCVDIKESNGAKNSVASKDNNVANDSPSVANNGGANNGNCVAIKDNNSPNTASADNNHANEASADNNHAANKVSADNNHGANKVSADNNHGANNVSADSEQENHVPMTRDKQSASHSPQEANNSTAPRNSTSHSPQETNNTDPRHLTSHSPQETNNTDPRHLTSHSPQETNNTDPRHLTSHSPQETNNTDPRHLTSHSPQETNNTDPRHSTLHSPPEANKYITLVPTESLMDPIHLCGNDKKSTPDGNTNSLLVVLPQTNTGKNREAAISGIGNCPPNVPNVGTELRLSNHMPINNMQISAFNLKQSNEANLTFHDLASTKQNNGKSMALNTQITGKGVAPNVVANSTDINLRNLLLSNNPHQVSSLNINQQLEPNVSSVTPQSSQTFTSNTNIYASNAQMPYQLQSTWHLPTIPVSNTESRVPEINSLRFPNYEQNHVPQTVDSMSRFDTPARQLSTAIPHIPHENIHFHMNSLPMSRQGISQQNPQMHNMNEFNFRRGMLYPGVLEANVIQNSQCGRSPQIAHNPPLQELPVNRQSRKNKKTEKKGKSSAQQKSLTSPRSNQQMSNHYSSVDRSADIMYPQYPYVQPPMAMSYAPEYGKMNGSSKNTQEPPIWRDPCGPHQPYTGERLPLNSAQLPPQQFAQFQQSVEESHQPFSKPLGAVNGRQYLQGSAHQRIQESQSNINLQSGGNYTSTEAVQHLNNREAQNHTQYGLPHIPQQMQQGESPTVTFPHASHGFWQNMPQSIGQKSCFQSAGQPPTQVSQQHIPTVHHYSTDESLEIGRQQSNDQSLQIVGHHSTKEVSRNKSNENCQQYTVPLAPGESQQVIKQIMGKSRLLKGKQSDQASQRTIQKPSVELPGSRTSKKSKQNAKPHVEPARKNSPQLHQQNVLVAQVQHQECSKALTNVSKDMEFQREQPLLPIFLQTISDNSSENCKKTPGNDRPVETELEFAQQDNVIRESGTNQMPQIGNLVVPIGPNSNIKNHSIKIRSPAGILNQIKIQSIISLGRKLGPSGTNQNEENKKTNIETSTSPSSQNCKNKNKNIEENVIDDTDVPHLRSLSMPLLGEEEDSPLKPTEVPHLISPVVPTNNISEKITELHIPDSDEHVARIMESFADTPQSPITSIENLIVDCCPQESISETNQNDVNCQMNNNLDANNTQVHQNKEKETLLKEPQPLGYNLPENNCLQNIEVSHANDVEQIGLVPANRIVSGRPCIKIQRAVSNDSGCISPSGSESASSKTLEDVNTVDSGKSIDTTKENNIPYIGNIECICGKNADLVCECKVAIYCSVTCQQLDWKNHKDSCAAPSPPFDIEQSLFGDE